MKRAPDSLATSIIDPVTFAVIRNGLLAAASAIRTTFKRTAMLPLLYEFHDFGISVFDPECNLVADAPGIPAFVGSLDICLQHTLAEIGWDNVGPGDVLFNNHPYLTGDQPADAAVMEPIFFGDELVGFAALKGHFGDFGAKGPYPCDSTELYQEGVLFPPLKLYDAGVLNATVIEILRANSRLPSETVGSLLAGAGALGAGTARIRGLAERYGVDVLAAAMEEILDHGERVARGAIAEIPDGTYVLEDFLDDDGAGSGPVKVRCAVAIKDTDVTIDLTGSDPQQPGAINCPWAATLTTCKFALKQLALPDVPASGGQFRPLTVIAPEGCLFNPLPPAASWILGWSSARLGDMIVDALAPALPERLPAGHGGDLVAVLAYVQRPDTHDLAFFNDLGGLGHGAMYDHDGMNALVHAAQAGCEGIPTEILESRVPVRKNRFALIPDSGGPGKFRGGLAAVAEFEFTSEATAVIVAEKSRASSVRGLAGGMPPPSRNSVIVRPGTDTQLLLGKKADVSITAGDVIVVRPAGGGGHGDPLERLPGSVAHDVRNGYVSREASRTTYGVVLDERGSVLAGETRDLRQRIRAARDTTVPDDGARDDVPRGQSDRTR